MSAHKSSVNKSDVKNALKNCDGYSGIGIQNNRIKVYVKEHGCECETKGLRDYGGNVDFELSNSKKGVQPAGYDEVTHYKRTGALA